MPGLIITIFEVGMSIIEVSATPVTLGKMSMISIGDRFPGLANPLVVYS